MTAVSSGRATVLIFLLFAVVLVLTNPVGNFPLNDDWSYGQAVRNLVVNHEYRLTGWTSMPLLTQVLWGALFSLPAGSSFTALRFSTLFLSLAAVLLLLLLARRKDDPFLLSLFAPLVLLFNPVYLDLSHTFMTDVPFIAFMLGSVVLLVSGTERENRLLIACGVCLAVLASLIRQTGILIPAAFGIGYLARGRLNGRRTWFAAGFLLLTIAAYAVYSGWLSLTARLPAAYFTQWPQVRSVLATGLAGASGQVTRNLLITYVYLGIFTLPVGLLFITRASKRRLLLLCLLSAVLLGAAQFLHVSFPGNILSDRGVGPFTLAHTEAFHAFTASAAAKVAIGLLALLGGTLLLEMLVGSVKQVRSSPITAICLSLAGMSLLSLSLVSQLDRYAVLYLPLLLAAAAPALRGPPPSRPVLAAAFAVLLAYAGFSVSAVHDYMAWNRARWQATNHLMNNLAVSPDHIDGGFEFNGLHTYSEGYARTPGKSPWWVKDNEYVVAFDVLPGYVTLRTYPVKAWLPSGIRRLCLLRRADAWP